MLAYRCSVDGVLGDQSSLSLEPAESVDSHTSRPFKPTEVEKDKRPRHLTHYKRIGVMSVGHYYLPTNWECRVIAALSILLCV